MSKLNKKRIVDDEHKLFRDAKNLMEDLGGHLVLLADNKKDRKLANEALHYLNDLNKNTRILDCVLKYVDGNKYWSYEKQKEILRVKKFLIRVKKGQSIEEYELKKFAIDITKLIKVIGYGLERYRRKQELLRTEGTLGFQIKPKRTHYGIVFAMILLIVIAGACTGVYLSKSDEGEDSETSDQGKLVKQKVVDVGVESKDGGWGISRKYKELTKNFPKSPKFEGKKGGEVCRDDGECESDNCHNFQCAYGDIECKKNSDCPNNNCDTEEGFCGGNWAGQGCKTSIDCSPALLCYEGGCRPRINTLGDSCTGFVDCSVGQECVGGNCQKEKKDAGVDGGDKLEDLEDINCESDANCVASVCKNSRCVKQVAEGNCKENNQCYSNKCQQGKCVKSNYGESCSGDIDCAVDYYCGDVKGEFKCRTRKTQGMICDAINECVADLVCKDNICFKEAGEWDICKNTGDCGEGLICVDNKCRKKITKLTLSCISDEDCGGEEGVKCFSGKCLKFAEKIGDLCFSGRPCMVGVCSGGECTESSKVTCVNNADCMEHQKCLGNRCVIDLTKKIDVLKCNSDMQCLSGVCKFGICVET